MTVRFLVLGDSITWGQGLLPTQKFSMQVATALGFKPEETLVFAHSGAIIGADDSGESHPRLDGEVPAAFPSILEQVDFCQTPDTITHIVLTGGINDTDLKTILNPLTQKDKLRNLVRTHCHTGMKALLNAVLARYRHPELRIVVTGYFPILSEESLESDQAVDIAWRFLQQRGIDVPLLHGLELPLAPIHISAHFSARFVLLDKTVELCKIFWKDSTQWLSKAVQDTNAAHGANRVSFADPGFEESNAGLASHTWLWGVNFDPELSPMDPVAGPRREACRRDEPDFLRRFACDRASAGHPNPTGAQQFASAILKVWQAGGNA